ncbi:LCP family protein, partial [Bacillus altitudinis]
YVIAGNFKAFQDIVDELNGIDVTIEDEGIAKQMEKDSKGKVHVETGTHTLSGEEALAFVRTRKADSDL